jgi:hypothetical protein
MVRVRHTHTHTQKVSSVTILRMTTEARRIADTQEVTRTLHALATSSSPAIGSPSTVSRVV